MRAVFVAAAAAEFEEALRHYRAISERQGERFRRSVLAAVRRAMDPLVQRRRIAPGVHMVRCAGFPYLLAFDRRATEVRVLVVAHERRNPVSWRGRLGPQD